MQGGGSLGAIGWVHPTIVITCCGHIRVIHLLLRRLSRPTVRDVVGRIQGQGCLQCSGGIIVPISSRGEPMRAGQDSPRGRERGGRGGVGSAAIGARGLQSHH